MHFIDPNLFDREVCIDWEKEEKVIYPEVKSILIIRFHLFLHNILKSSIELKY